MPSNHPPALAATVANEDCQVVDCIPSLICPGPSDRSAAVVLLFFQNLSIDSVEPQFVALADSGFCNRLNSGSWGKYNNLDANAHVDLASGSQMNPD